MSRYLWGACSLFLFAQPALAASDADLDKIRAEVQQLKQTYEARIQALEARLQKAESRVDAAQATAQQAQEQVTQVASAPPPAAAAPAGANAFNPDISLILSGTYANLSQDPNKYRLTGFIPSPESSPGTRSFSLGESELGVYANIDPYLHGGLNLALAPDNTLSVEEAFIQTLGLGHGLTIKAGRFFSAIGYLNEQHAHTWDFVDNPLAYKAFLGTQFSQDGVQLKWLAPTDTFLEVGAEIGGGGNFPGSERNRNGIGSAALFAHVGGDIGFSQSWRAGVSYLQTKPQSRSYEDSNLSGATVTNAFSGNSHLWVADFVWKWAPNGNVTHTNFKLQGEYFRRREAGALTYDTTASTLSSAYAATQSGAYLQGVYQFMPRWRVGLRRDQLDSGHVDYSLNNAYLARPDYAPSKNSVMLDYNPSEFSRFRLQLAQDKSRQGVTDNQIFLQYLMSLGAHGAHQF